MSAWVFAYYMYKGGLPMLLVQSQVLCGLLLVAVARGYGFNCVVQKIYIKYLKHN